MNDAEKKFLERLGIEKVVEAAIAFYRVHSIVADAVDKLEHEPLPWLTADRSSVLAALTVLDEEMHRLLPKTHESFKSKGFPGDVTLV